eukprot:3938457-Rhodomonas_salina.1
MDRAGRKNDSSEVARDRKLSTASAPKQCLQGRREDSAWWLVQQGMVDENGAWLHSRYHEW